MGDPTGFLTHGRQDAPHRPVAERTKDYAETDAPLSAEDLMCQASRCMDCGIPFCHGTGCPLANRIPEFNDLVYRGRWRDALDVLQSTNNFPEITGRICPAPCEASCTLNINDDPVLIRHIEMQIVERGFAEGWIQPQPPAAMTEKRVAVVGSGPAGLAAAQQLARAGHEVIVYEKDHRPGGLLRYGIPDFKLDKSVLDRRIEQMEAEGVRFQTDVLGGEDLSASFIQRRFDAICLTMGAGEPRDLDVPGRELDGVHFAMDFLAEQNRRNAGELGDTEVTISAAGKHVVVIGGGDTGSDCVGSSIRRNAASVTQVEILPQPPEASNPQTPWPLWPLILRTSTSQEEGCERMWCVLTKELIGSGGRVTELKAAKVDWTEREGRQKMSEVDGGVFTLKADLVLLAMGFVHVTHSGLAEALGVEFDDRGDIVTNNHMTSVEGVFAAGDAATGASLVVRAIDAGRETAAAVDAWLRR